MNVHIRSRGAVRIASRHWLVDIPSAAESRVQIQGNMGLRFEISGGEYEVVLSLVLGNTHTWLLIILLFLLSRITARTRTPFQSAYSERLRFKVPVDRNVASALYLTRKCIRSADAGDRHILRLSHLLGRATSTRLAGVYSMPVLVLMDKPGTQDDGIWAKDSAYSNLVEILSHLNRLLQIPLFFSSG